MERVEEKKEKEDTAAFSLWQLVLESCFFSNKKTAR